MAASSFSADVCSATAASYLALSALAVALGALRLGVIVFGILELCGELTRAGGDEVQLLLLDVVPVRTCSCHCKKRCVSITAYHSKRKQARHCDTHGCDEVGLSRRAEAAG